MIAENDSPKYLACPWCPAQSFLTGVRSIGWDNTPMCMYQCPAKHTFYIEAEDTSFNFGHNKEDE